MRSKTPKNSPPHNHHTASPSSSPTSLTESILQEAMKSAENIIPRWWFYDNSNLCISAPLFSTDGAREHAVEFISAVNNLQSAIRFTASRNASSKLLLRSQELVQMGMKRLEWEFSFILSTKNEMGSDRLTDLKSIADCMMNCGYSKQCAEVYTTVRKSVVDKVIYHLGIDRLSLDLQRGKVDWDVVASKINNWLCAMKIAVNSVFSEEKILCDFTFSSSLSLRESCFAEVATNSAVSILSFPEQVAPKFKRSPEKLFKILDLYEAITEVSPEINTIFSSDASSPVRAQLETTLEKLKEAARTALSEFESAIQKDTSNIPVTGGGVHPLNRYVMNYLSLLSDYTDVLEEILATWQLNINAPLPEEYSVSHKNSKLQVRFAWFILVLLSKLDRKSEIYNEVSLSYLFLANNLRYTVKKVQSSELWKILGDSWIDRHEEKVRKYAASYERFAWSIVFDPVLEESSSSGHKTAKERFRRFNCAFLEAQKKHMEWVVVDPSLREEIKESLARSIVSRYRDMYMRYRDGLAREIGSGESVIRYAPEDLENYFWGLLFGCSDGDSKTRSRDATTLFSSSYSSPQQR